MTNSVLYNMLVDYIEENKRLYNIDYTSSIENLKELLEEIEQDYKDLEGENNE